MNWDAYNLPAISTLMAAEDECTGADRVLAWDGLATALQDQHKRLTAAAAALADIWPPDQNASARLYLDTVNELAASMSETMIKAQDTKVGLQGVIKALGDAQSEIRVLAEGRAAVGGDLIPRFIDHAEDKYDARAQQVMRSAETVVAEYSAQIQAPALYELKPPRSDRGEHLTSDEAVSGSASGIKARVTAVSMPTDYPAMDAADARGGIHGDGGASAGSASGRSSATGPVLSGAAQTPAAVGPLAPAGAAAVNGPGVLPIGFDVASGAGVPTVGGGVAGVFGAMPRRGGTSDPRRSAPTRRALPSGAVIGEAADEGVGSRGTTLGQVPFMANGSGARGKRSDESSIGVPDQQWLTRRGVAPVIEPDRTPVKHDPGPGVIGLSR